MKSLTKSAILPAVVLAAYLGTASIHLVNRNLDGEWNYNEYKSEESPYNFPRYLPLKLKISTGANSLTIETTIWGNGGKANQVAIEKVPTDGTEAESIYLERFKEYPQPSGH